MSFRFVASKVVQTFITLLIIVSIVMLSLAMVPGDPVRLMLGPYATEEQIQLVREQLGLNLPLHIRYVRYLTGLLQGDLGRSYHYDLPVAELISIVYPRTLWLVAVALIFSLSIAIPVGVISAVRQYSALDYAVRFLTYIAVCIPIFVFGIMLLHLLAVRIPIFPVAVVGSTTEIIVLPALTLSVYSAPAIARMTRSSMLDVVRQDYITTARAKGLSERRVILKHALRNALIPIYTYTGLQFGLFLGGSIITETIFAYPGMGTLMVNAIYERDYPLIQGCVLVFALSFILVNMFIDLTYALIDPRIKRAR